MVRAVADNQDPRTIILFDGNENIINHFYKVPYPFTNGRINSPEYSRQNVANVLPCQRRIAALNTIKYNLRRHPPISNMLAQKVV